MRHFQNDNTHLQIVNQGKKWPFVDNFHGLLPAEGCMNEQLASTDCIDEDHMYVSNDSQPCLKYVLGCLSPEDIFLLKIYEQKYDVSLQLNITVKKFSNVLGKGRGLSQSMITMLKIVTC